MILLELYYEFFKIGLFAIGGGMAAIPFLRHLAVSSEWFSIAFITDMIAISESTPGPIGINMATYAGYNISGRLGGIAATLGMITPSIISVTIVAKYLDKYRNSHILDQIFWGLRPAVTGLIAVAGFDILRTVVFNANFEWLKLVYFLVIFYLIKRFKKHPITYVAISAFVGILLNFGTH